MIKHTYLPLPRRMAWCGLCMVALLVVLASCGGGSGAVTNTSSPTVGSTATVGTTITPSVPSPTPTTQGVTPTPTPTRSKPTPTPTQSKPTPTPTQPKPTPTPTHAPPTTVNASIINNNGFAFSPLTLNITVGSTVIWTNNTTVPHTVTSDNGVFDSGMLSPGTSYRFTFTKAGTYNYHCSIHPYMTATIIVK